MDDEQLRKFCLEQAVILYSEKEKIKGFCSPVRTFALLDVADALFDYLKNGEKTDLPFSSYLY